MTKANYRSLIHAALTLTAFSPITHAQTTTDIAITAWGMHYGSDVIYKYQVKNSGSNAIKRILVGLHHPQNGEGNAELTTLPRNNGKSHWLAPDIAKRPEGWGVKLFFPEESEKFAIEWVEGTYFKEISPASLQDPNAPSPHNPPKVQPPKTTWDAFSVTLAKPDFAYANGHASIDYGTAVLNVPVQKGDTSPPTLDVITERVNTNGSNGKWAIYEVKASARDNYDPSPRLIFEPISSNQALDSGDYIVEARKNSWKIWLRNVPGRVYQMRYVSYDASGNTAVKEIEYKVDPSLKKSSYLTVPL
ncbi:MAG TPA: hypothetical protein VFF81_05635 [Noviherbaspirillum sp.]|nr:hypothetical protein [Noviherbaspirillum sp.]